MTTPKDYAADYKQRITDAYGDFMAKSRGEKVKRRSDAGSEKSEQRRLAAWLDAHGILWLHPANERKASVQQHVSLKAQGVKSGAPDVLIFSAPPTRTTITYRGMLLEDTCCRGVAIELKRLSGKATVSVNQLDWLEKLRGEGWLAKVCCGAGEAIDWLTSLGFGVPR